MNYPSYLPTQQPAGQLPAYGQRSPIMQPQFMRPAWPAPQPIKVNGKAGAEAFYMGPNETAVLFDENADVFFFKTTDGAGYPTIRSFGYAPLQEQGAAELPYATKDELEDLRKELSELKGVLNNGKQPVRAKPKAEE